MRELIAGDGGSVLVAAAGSPSAVALACEGLGTTTRTPSGIAVYPADAIPDDLDVGVVRVTACEPATRAAIEAWAARRGIEVVDAAAATLHAPDGVRVVAVSAMSTGSGKTALVRRAARTLVRSGVRVAVARHPIATLLAWDRFDPVIVRTPPELGVSRPVDEREELAPLVGAGIPVVTGLDPERVLRMAANEAGRDGVVVWDGGGAALPWIEPLALHLVAIDLLRPVSRPFRDADAYVLTKADSAKSDRARDTERALRSERPDVPVVLADMSIGVQPTNVLADKRVVIVEDASSLMLGGLAAGAGAVAARRFRCGVVDPRPFAIGAIAAALRRFEHIAAVIPSLGRTPDEIADLAASVYATPGDAVLWASNADPASLIPDETRPIVRAFGELAEVAGPPLQELLAALLPGHD